MTRKRYIKLVMATGRDRNTAKFMATLCRGHRQPYAQSWEKYKCSKPKRAGMWFFAFLTTLPPIPQGGGGNE